MATSRIKGITVEINGDTTGLSKALSSVNKEMKSTHLRFAPVGAKRSCVPVARVQDRPERSEDVHWTISAPAEGCGETPEA